MQFQKGQEVYLIDRFGDRRGQPDTSHKYIIRSIGRIKSIVDRVREPSEPRVGIYRHPGRAFYIYTPEEARSRYTPSNWPTNWNQVFCPLGEPGFNPKENY